MDTLFFLQFLLYVGCMKYPQYRFLTMLASFVLFQSLFLYLSRIHKTQQDTEGTKCFPPVSRGRLFLSIAG